MAFDHERLDVYQVALDFAVLAEQLRDEIPKGRGHLADQLHRASASIVLNIAEGTGKFGRLEKRRFYSIAAGSAAECAGLLGLLGRLKLIPDPRREEGKLLLERTVSMLIRLAASMERRV